MEFSHYLMFNRNCSNALEVYAKAFNAKILEMMKYGDIPQPGFPIADNDKDLILHARLKFGDTEIMCADSSEPCQPGENMYVTITSQDSGQIKHAWDILKTDGEVYMDLAPSFFADLHGSLRDKFGINWMFTATR